MERGGVAGVVGRAGEGWEALSARSHIAPLTALRLVSTWRRKRVTPLDLQRCGFEHSSPPPRAVALAQQERSPNGALITLQKPPSPYPKIEHQPKGRAGGMR